MSNCEFPQNNATSQEIETLLNTSKVVAIVGLSTDESKDSNRVARYLQDAGYKIIPVNPSADTILGEKSYADLASIPEKVDIVNIFRKPEAIPQIVDEAIPLKPKAIWMQLGLVNNEAATKARAQGILVVMNKCIKIELASI